MADRSSPLARYSVDAAPVAAALIVCALACGPATLGQTTGLSEARADSAARVIWNWWNNVDGPNTKRWIKNPGGSTYVMQAKVGLGALPAGQPPALPFPVLPGVASFPAAPPSAAKFIEIPAGTAVAGKAWGPGAAGVVAGGPPPAPPYAQAQGSSAVGRFFWSATGNTKAKAGGPGPRNHAWAKVFDPWLFHDFAPADPNAPGTNDFLTVTGSLTFSDDLDVSTLEPGLDGTVGSITEVNLLLDGAPQPTSLFSIATTLEKIGGEITFTPEISVNPDVRLFNFTVDDGGTPGDPIDDTVQLGSEITFSDLSSMIGSFFDPSGRVTGTFDVAFALDLPFTLAEYQSPGFEIGATFSHESLAAVVPEPASLVLLSAGAAFVLRRRSRFQS